MTARQALKNEANEAVKVIDELGNDLTEKPIEFTYDGEEYTFSKDDLDDVDVIEGFEDGKLVSPVRRILGDKQWATFKSKKRTSQDLADMVTLMFDEVGVEPGE